MADRASTDLDGVLRTFRATTVAKATITCQNPDCWCWERA